MIAFILLTLNEVFFTPFQSTYYMLFRELMREEPLFDEKSFFRFNVLTVIIRLAGLLVSLPYWRYMGII